MFVASESDAIASAIFVISTTLIAIVVSIAAWVNIVRKAGYSGWYVLGLLFPLINGILFLIFAFVRWPIQDELLRLRAKCGELTVVDAEALCDAALRVEKRGDWMQAIDMYDAVAKFSDDREVVQSARISLQRLKERIGQTS